MGKSYGVFLKYKISVSATPKPKTLILSFCTLEKSIKKRLTFPFFCAILFLSNEVKSTGEPFWAFRKTGER
jgi:hypothetical protein